jgi:hypothetical protein
MSDEDFIIEKPQKAPIMPSVVAMVLFSGAYGIGHLALTAPEPLMIAGTEAEMAAEEVDTGPVPRRYVSFPISITVNVPRWGTMLIDMGMAVHEELPDNVTEAFLTDSAPLTAPLSEAMLAAVEDPEAKDLEALQRIMPPLLRDAMNGVISTEDLPDPVIEVYILKLITTG